MHDPRDTSMLAPHWLAAASVYGWVMEGERGQAILVPGEWELLSSLSLEPAFTFDRKAVESQRLTVTEVANGSGRRVYLVRYRFAEILDEVTGNP